MENGPVTEAAGGAADVHHRRRGVSGYTAQLRPATGEQRLQRVPFPSRRPDSRVSVEGAGSEGCGSTARRTPWSAPTSS